MAFWLDVPTAPVRPGSDENPSALDYAKTVGAATADTAAGLASTGQFAAEQQSQPIQNNIDTAQALSEGLHGVSEYLLGSETPAGIDTQENPQDHPKAAVANAVAGVLPAVGAFAAAPEGAIPEAVMGGGLQASGLIDHVISETNDMTDDELANKSPTFKSYIESGMDPQEARIKLHSDMISTPALAASILTGGIAGGLGGRLLRGTASAALGDGMVQQVLTGGVEGGAAAGAMTGQSEYATQNADVQGGLRDKIDAGEIASDAASSALGFGVFGAAAGGFHALASRPSNTRPVQTSDVGPDAAQLAALKGSQDTSAVVPAPTDVAAQAASEPAPAPVPSPAPEVPPATPSEPAASAPVEATPPSGATPNDVGVAMTPPTSTDPVGTVPEPPATLQAQQDQLIAGDRKAQLFPKGVPPLPLPDGMQTARTSAGVIHFDPKQVTRPEVMSAVKSDTLGQLLGLGDVTKQQAADGAARGETPTATVERTPEGVEVRAAAGTDQTASDQKAAMEAVASPENTVSTENPADVLDGRVAEAANPVAPEPEPTPHDIAAKDNAVPTPEQAKSGDYSMGKAKIHGLDTTIETPKGETRTADDGSWQVKDMPAHYGFIDGTKGADGDEIDTYIGPHPKAPRVFIIDQVDPATGKFDEHKVMMGFDSQRDAQEAYNRGFSDGSGPSRRGATMAMDVGKFKEWLKKADTTKAVRYDEKLKGALLRDESKPEPKPAPIERGKETRTGAHESTAAKTRRDAEAKTIDGIVKNSVPEYYEHADTKEARDALAKRLDDILDQMDKAGIDIKAKANYENRPGQQVYASEAKRMLAALKTHDGAKIPKEFQERITSFLINEQHAKRGDFEPLRSSRRQDADAIRSAVKKGEHVDVENSAHDGAEAIASDIKSPEEQLAAKQEATDGGYEPDTSGDFSSGDEAYEAGKDRETSIPADAVTAGKDATGSGVTVEKRSGRKVLSVKLHGTDIPGESKGEANTSPSKWVPDPKEVVMTTSMARAKLDFNDQDSHESVFTPARAQIWDRLKSLVGHVPIDVVDHDHMQDIAKRNGLDMGAGEVNGWYDPKTQRIVMSDEQLRKGNTFAGHVMIHEAVHAAFLDTINRSADLRAAVEAMRTALKNSDGARLKMLGESYGLTDAHEFVSEALSNPVFQDYIARVPAPDDVVRYLNDLDDYKGKPLTMWDTLRGLVRKYVLRLPRMLGKGDSMLDAMMRVSGHLEDEVTGDHAIYNDLVAPSFKSAVTEPDDAPKPFIDTAKKVQDAAIQAVKDKALSTANMKRAWRKVFTLDQMRQQYAKLFPEGTFRKHADLMNQSDAYSHKLQKPGDELARLTSRLSGKYAGKVWQAYADLQDSARRFKAHPDRALTDAGNKHLADVSNLQGAAKHPELVEQYNALPSELKDLWKRTTEFYSDNQEARSRQLLDAVTDGKNVPQDIKDRIIDGTSTAQDHTDLESIMGNEERANELVNSTIFRKVDGPYFPLSRRGDFVVQAKHIINAPDLADAQPVRGGEHSYEFKDRAKAEKWAASLPTVADVEATHFDPDTAKAIPADKLSDYDDKAKYPNGPDTRYRVTADDQHMELHTSETDARNAMEALKKDPTMTKVQDVRRKNSFAVGELSSAHVQQMAKRLGEGKSEAAKKKILEELEESALTMQKGNRILKHQIEAKRTAGASRDLVRNLVEYNVGAARAMARMHFEKEVEANLKDMRAFNRATNDGQGLMRDDVLKDVEGRMHNTYASDPGGAFNAVSNTMMSLSFMKLMMSPAHLLVHMTHPGMISLPILGARHGYAKASLALNRAYADMGRLSALGEGAKGAYRLGRDATAAPTNFVDYFKGKISSASDAQRLGRMLDTLTENGLIHPEAGMEVHRMAPGRNVVMRGLDRVDGAFRELTSATESINRVAEAISAYRLEMDKTGDHDAAVRYAGDTLANTQGLYSKANSAPIFQNKFARPFLQFKQYPQMIYHLLGRQLVDAFKGDTKEVRMAAAKSFAGVVATHAIMAGALGLPLELAKIPVMVAHALGLTSVTWDELEQGFQKDMGEEFGGYAGQIISHGVTRALGPLSIDVHHRLGLNSLLSFGEPDSDKPEDTTNYLLTTLAGAPASMVKDTLTGSQDMLKGDFLGATEKLLPARAFVDIAKGVTLATVGKPNSKGQPGLPPQGIGPGIVQALGFKPGKLAQYDEAHWAGITEQKNDKDERTKLTSDWVAAKGADKQKAYAAVQAYNKGKPLSAQLTYKQLSSASKKKDGDTILGLAANKHNNQMLRDTQSNYNVD